MDILVVENDLSVLSHIVELIQAWGHRAEKSETAHNALNKVTEYKFDLILMDISLPDMASQELIVKLKELSPGTGIVTMTGTSNKELEKEIRTLGIIYYMSKPVSKKVLKEIIDHISLKKMG